MNNRGQMENETQPTRQGGRIYAWLAWGNLCAGFLISSTLGGCLVIHETNRGGERPPAVLVFYSILLVANAGATLAGLWSLFGIRSWRHGLIIIPGALLGIGLNAFSAFICVLGITRSLEGRAWQ